MAMAIPSGDCHGHGKSAGGACHGHGNPLPWQANQMTCHAHGKLLPRTCHGHGNSQPTLGFARSMLNRPEGLPLARLESEELPWHALVP